MSAFDPTTLAAAEMPTARSAPKAPASRHALRGAGNRFALNAAIPRHVAIAPGGHRQWAAARLQPEGAALIRGLSSLLAAVEACGAQQIEELTVFALMGDHSLDAFDDAGSYWTPSLMRALKTELAKLPTKGVRFRLLGQWPPLDPALMGMLQEAQARTRHNTGLHLNLLPARPQKQAWAQTAHFQVTHPPPRPDGLAVDSGESQHCDPAPTEPDLLIRTGGCPTAEDAMVWDTSHTALYFTDLPWPDVSAAVFRQAVRWYGLEDRARGVQIGRASLGVQRHNPCAAL